MVASFPMPVMARIVPTVPVAFPVGLGVAPAGSMVIPRPVSMYRWRAVGRRVIYRGSVRDGAAPPGLAMGVTPDGDSTVQATGLVAIIV